MPVIGKCYATQVAPLQASMAANNQSTTCALVQQRTLKVTECAYPSRKSDSYYLGDRKVPSIQLKGHWLKEAGFACGNQVSVQIEHGCIKIILNDDHSK